MHSLTTAEAAAARAAGVRPTVLLVEMQLTPTPLYLCTARMTLNYAGREWLGAGLVGSVEEISESASDIKPLRFTLSCVPNEMLSLALSAGGKGRTVRVHLLVLDQETYQPALFRQIWAGVLDQMSVEEGSEFGAVSVSAIHMAEIFRRPRPLRYNDADQQKIAPGDRGCSFIATQQGQQVVWPSVEYLKR
jgi:hypothetical protein